MVQIRSKQNQNEKGITLVALVVTIVVLLILAGVSIVTLFDENGIIKGAQKAKEETEKGIQNDIAGLQNLTNELNKYASSDFSENDADLNDYVSLNLQSYIGVYMRQKANYMKMNIEISDVSNEADKIIYAIGTDWKENIKKENDDANKLFLKNASTLEMIRVNANDPNYEEKSGKTILGSTLLNGFTDVRLSNLKLKKGKIYKVTININRSYYDIENKQYTSDMLEIYKKENLEAKDQDITLNIAKSEVSNIRLMFDMYKDEYITPSDYNFFRTLINESDELKCYKVELAVNDETTETSNGKILINENGDPINELADKYVGFDYNRDGYINYSDALIIAQLNRSDNF